MPIITFLIGVMLILLGIGGYGFGVAFKNPSVTALIPSVIGLIFVVLGGLSMNVKLRKHALHAAVLVALLGVLVAGGRLLSGVIAGKMASGVGLASLSLMTIFCLILLVLGVNSFIQARRNRLNA
ncbi:MAG: hypothetical protein H7Z37_03460 [Pyrinomonadaceae bacterium]|nr:hypothetical protein [Pyrinomonadaceae bacterium]